MAGSGRGITTPEYQLFQKHYSDLSTGIAQAVEAVAEKALEKRLIGPENVAKALNKTKTEFERSSELTLLLHSRVGQRAKDFYVIVEILKSISSLDHLVELLAPEQASEHNAQGTAGTAIDPPRQGALEQASGQASKLKTRPSNREAFLALKPIANKWKTIGTLLELPPGTLDSIQSESHRDQDRVREMVAEWLKTLDATWEALIEAVEEEDKTRASEIKRKFCS